MATSLSFTPEPVSDATQDQPLHTGVVETGATLGGLTEAGVTLGELERSGVTLGELERSGVTLRTIQQRKQ